MKCKALFSLESSKRKLRYSDNEFFSIKCLLPEFDFNAEIQNFIIFTPSISTLMLIFKKSTLKYLLLPLIWSSDPCNLIRTFAGHSGQPSIKGFFKSTAKVLQMHRLIQVFPGVHMSTGTFCKGKRNFLRVVLLMILFVVSIGVLRNCQLMSSVDSLPNHKFTGQV